MSLNLMSISVHDALNFLRIRYCVVGRQEKGFAIAVRDDQIRGAIVMFADGEECKLMQIYGDGTSQVQTLLYGAAWRAAKALGYKQITI